MTVRKIGRRFFLLGAGGFALARLLRGYAVPALEDVALWHERDISHSSVERVSFPDATILTDFMLARATGLVRGLVVHRERMRANLEASGGLCFSEAVLLALDQVLRDLRAFDSDAAFTDGNSLALLQQAALDKLKKFEFAGLARIRDRLVPSTPIRSTFGACARACGSPASARRTPTSRVTR